MLFETLKSIEPGKLALEDSGRSIRYGDLELEIQNKVDALQNVRALGLALGNGVEWILWDLASLKARVPCVPLPPFFTESQLGHVIQSAAISHIISPEGIRETGISLPDLLPEGTAKVTFTSGTTGNPKGVCLPQSAMEQVASGIVQMLGQQFVGTHASVLPLAVLLENVAGVYAGLMAGCTIRFTGLAEFGPSYENIHTQLAHTEAMSAILVPEILRILMAQVALKGPLPDLKFVAIGGSKVDSTLIFRARKMGLPVYEGYGLSECASVVSLNTPERDMPGTVGQTLPHIEAQIVDGELLIEHPGFLGYVGEKPPATLKTGDLGSFDEKGFLSITGRKKNVLITSYGRNISPEWPEAVLLSQAEIAQAVVYGDAQPALSTLIVPSCANADVPAALKKANDILPDYARISHFQVVPPFTLADDTLTGTGRLRREQILNKYIKG